MLVLARPVNLNVFATDTTSAWRNHFSILATNRLTLEMSNRSKFHDSNGLRF